MVGVVFIHSPIVPRTDGGLFYVVFTLFSEIIPRVSVPFFFFISGYLFFYRRWGNRNPQSSAGESTVSEFDRKTYFQKLKKRCRTLLVPYVFWNAAWIFVCLSQIPIIYTFFKAYPLADDFVSLLEHFWASPLWMTISKEWPICVQFWFIRDLMVIIVLSPILYWGIKKLKFVFLVLLCLLYFASSSLRIGDNFLNFNLFSITGFNVEAIFFFTLGAGYSLNSRLWLRDFSKFQVSVFILYPILVVLDLISRNEIVHKIQILVGIVFFANLVTRFIMIQKNKKIESFLLFLGSSSFFLFALHQPWLKERTRDIVQRILPATTDLYQISGYFLQIFLCIIISGITYYFSRKFFPRTTNLVTGGR
jgi:surface polysaccharide O-acyltransferase-like enzyme